MLPVPVLLPEFVLLPAPVLLLLELLPPISDVLLELSLDFLWCFLWCFLPVVEVWPLALWSVDEVVLPWEAELWLWSMPDWLDAAELPLLPLEPWLVAAGDDDPDDWVDEPVVSVLCATTKALATSNTANVLNRCFMKYLLLFRIGFAEPARFTTE